MVFKCMCIICQFSLWQSYWPKNERAHPIKAPSGHQGQRKVARRLGQIAVRVHGDSLPRTVAVNDSAIKPILLASGPAVRWIARRNAAAPHQTWSQNKGSRRSRRMK